MEATEGFVEAMVASPLGVTLLAVLESHPHGGEEWELSLETTPASVDAAVECVEAMSFGSFVHLAVLASMIHIGPWMSPTPSVAASAYRHAEARLPIAEAVVKCFGEHLHATVDRSAQQWWTDGSPWLETLTPLFENYGHVEEGGEVTLAGLWTATDPPNEALEQMVAAWEIETGPVSRWSMPALPEARVFEIHRAEDWAQLVAAHPASVDTHFGWELPGPNQHLSQIAPLLDVPGQRAARAKVAAHLVPDWHSVAREFDGIHLSWAGFITADGCIVDLAGGDVAMLRYWFSERTLWLTDVFGEPRLAPDPRIDLSGDHEPPLPPRIDVDSVYVSRLLGRTPLKQPSDIENHP